MTKIQHLTSDQTKIREALAKQLCQNAFFQKYPEQMLRLETLATQKDYLKVLTTDVRYQGLRKWLESQYSSQRFGDYVDLSLEDIVKLVRSGIERLPKCRCALHRIGI